MRHLNRVAPLALVFVCAQVWGADKPPSPPPPELADYVAAVRKADEIADPLQRCLAYPDLPGNTWTPGLAKARCTMFLTPPLYTLDALAHALAQPDGAKAVDARFTSLLDAHFTVPDQREHIFIALGIFDGNQYDQAERVARAWLAASPDSAFARTALAHVLVARGWKARGTRFAQDTPAESLRAMDKFFLEAGDLYTAALKSNAKLLPACVGLMKIGRQSSDAVQEQATRICMQADPASYFVVEEMMDGAEPRWGGSPEAMRAVGAYAQARVEQNPPLALFAFHHAFYPIDRAGDEADAQALAVLVPTAMQIPNAAHMRVVGGAYLRKDDYWKAFVYKSQVLRFSPGDWEQWRWRAFIQYKLGAFEGARSDAERAVALSPGYLRGHALLGDALRATGRPAEARPHYARAMESPDMREGAFVADCKAAIEARQTDEAVACAARLIAEYPKNTEAQRLSFGVRVARATHLERSPEGRDYFTRYLPQTTPTLNAVMTACFGPSGMGGKQDSFTAVLDVLGDGRIANVEVAPINARTSCYAERVAKMKAPAPPAAFAEKGFPVAYQFDFR